MYIYCWQCVTLFRFFVRIVAAGQRRHDALLFFTASVNININKRKGCGFNIGSFIRFPESGQPEAVTC